ncbi:MAG: hybrid sensor histidine kinase/response regulator [Oceanicaulis sp.]
MTDAPAKTAPDAAQPDALEGGAPEAPAPEARPAPREGRLARPLTRAVFWTASLMALIAAAVAIVAGAGAGWQGVVLLSGIAACALLLMYALAAGEAAGRALGRDAPASAAPGFAHAALEALGDPVLITARGGRPVWANKAYRDLAGAGLSAPRPAAAPAPERLFTGAAAGPVYRLTRAADSGERAEEMLGPLSLHGEGAAVYRAEVGPVEGGGALWRFQVARGEDGEAADAAPDWAEHAPVGLFLADAEGRVLAANATLRGWIGATPDQALKLKDFLAGDAAAAFARSRGAEGAARLDARMVAREGVESPVVLSVVWSDDKPARARGVVYGLSATGAPPGLAQIAAQSGAKPGRTFDDMFAAAPFGVARLDGADPASAMVEDANPALLQLTGGAALPGVKFADLFDVQDGLTAAFERALSGSGEPGEARLKGEDGRPVHLFLAPARGGKRAAYIVDITAWKALETQVAQAGKMQAVGQLASGLAHDFNNMLTAIRLNVGELLNRHPVGDPSYQDLQQINSTVTRQAGLVRKLLAFSRKQTFRMTVFDISDVLSDCSVMLGQILEETVKLDIRHGRDLPLIRADRNQIDNILVNLATNARDAMKGQGGGVLTITTEAVDADTVRKAGAPSPGEGRWAAIHVADTGCGMDEETRKKIFEPFFTTKATGEGTGLGLATVYGVVKQSGGYLFVDSEPGKGTTFSIYLPGHAPSAEETAEIAAEAQAKAAEPKPSDLAGHGRILLVEDEDAVRKIAAKTLVRRGYEVVEACDGEEALEILEDNPESFDLLISDVVMPGLDGPSLLKEGRKYLGAARVVFISGYAEEEFSDTLSSDLEISFLPKPFDIQQLAERVKQELAAARG